MTRVNYQREPSITKAQEMFLVEWLNGLGERDMRVFFQLKLAAQFADMLTLVDSNLNIQIVDYLTFEGMRP